jgi:hypothetical protein
MSERLELVMLPAIAGHAHALDADGQPTCGCTSRVQAFHLPTNPALVRLQLSSFVRDSVKFSRCDTGTDIPGGGAA